MLILQIAAGILLALTIWKYGKEIISGIGGLLIWGLILGVLGGIGFGIYWVIRFHYRDIGMIAGGIFGCFILLGYVILVFNGVKNLWKTISGFFKKSSVESKAANVEEEGGTEY